MNNTNTNWFKFPAVYSNLFPKEIVKLAERAGVEPEEVAKRDNIEPGGVLDIWIRREELELLFRLEQHPYENWTFLYFDTGNVELAAENHIKLMRRIDKFLKMLPNYDLDSVDDFPPAIKEEISEMQDGEENEEE